MLMSATGLAGKEQEDRYSELVRKVPVQLRPIRSDEELDTAIAMIDSLLSKELLKPEEEDYLEVLSSLVEKYETEEHPIPPATDAEMLQHLIEAKGVSQTKVSEETGIVNSTISVVLSGKRALTRKHIDKLARYFKVSPTVFALPD